jgi:hypothetical protein
MEGFIRPLGQRVEGLMNFIKENFGYIVLSFLLCTIFTLGFTMSDEERSSAIIKEGSFHRCSTLRFAWIAQKCRERIFESKSRTCYFDECRQESVEMKKSFRDPLTIQLLFLGIFFLSSLLVADLLKKIFGRFKEDTYFFRHIDTFDKFLERKNLTKNKLSLVRGWRFEVIYLLIFAIIFCVFWGLFSWISSLASQ